MCARIDLETVVDAVVIFGSSQTRNGRPYEKGVRMLGGFGFCQASACRPFVEVNLVDKSGGGFALLGDFFHAERIGFEITPCFDDVCDRDPCLDRVFEIHLGIGFLGLIAGQPFDQLDRIVAVFGTFQDTGTRYVHVRLHLGLRR